MSEGATEQLLTDQSAITGDPESISKDYGDMCYYTCGVRDGQAIARVEAIAPASFVGRTAALTVGAGNSISRRRGQQVRPKASSVWARKPRQTMQSIGAVFGVFILATVATLISTLETSRTRPWTLELCVALMVAALPTRWDVMVTTIRSCGAALLAQSGAVVQRVHDVEDLAGVDVLCVDKTGTMTANILKATKVACLAGTPEDLVLSAGLASAILASSDRESLDPIDEACAQGLEEYGVSMEGYELIEFHPFESSTNYIRSDVIGPSGERETHVKGAPKAIMELCNQHADDYINDARAFARQGLRSLGVARKVDGKEWELLGQIALEDPPRADTAAAVKQAQELGMNVKMLTGDAAAIASLSARRFGLKHACVDTESVFANTKSETEKAKQCDHASVFSELSSAYRLDIVRTLQQTGHTVAITGDGSEDTAALRLADVGIAVEGASEKAQAAAEYVFFESGISAILMAVQRCRQIFELSFTYLQSRATLSLHLVVVTMLYALTYGEVFDPTLLLLALHCNESVTPAPSGPDADIPFSKKPVQWSSRVLWTSTLPLALILGAGTMLSIHSCEMQADVAATDTATRQQIIFLHTVLASSPLLLLKRTNSRFWKLSTWKRGAGMILAVDVAATASCLLGRAAANGSLDFASLRMVWICSTGSIVVAAGWLAVASAEKYDADDD
ncbi:HAD-like domain-containing protein [Neohortaea acidophila]|uniref:HAD-like domain-containing protein n=1 Tax=Neohortaea acidophila TaxID=245834 RepID=A0A6A6Q256_9PEZI|nr:HAD-like domain-containing protein [Neohortaea acidophila]KAF2486111.1 HAD-like domain-containing protein [Neohortaea acidophila]